MLYPLSYEGAHSRLLDSFKCSISSLGRETPKVLK